jgi:hypothetical protein
MIVHAHRGTSFAAINAYRKGESMANERDRTIDDSMTGGMGNEGESGGQDRDSMERMGDESNVERMRGTGDDLDDDEFEDAEDTDEDEEEEGDGTI